MKHLDASLQVCHSLMSSEGQSSEKRRKLESDSSDAAGEVGVSAERDPQLVTRLRSRLYYEKSTVFAQLGDAEAQATALKFSLRLSWSQEVARCYAQLQGGTVEESQVLRRRPGGDQSELGNNLCLLYLTDFSTVDK